MQGKQDRKSPVASPKPNQNKDNDGDGDEQKNQESVAPKVPPLKIVIPGGAGGSGRSGGNEQEEGKSDAILLKHSSLFSQSQLKNSSIETLTLLKSKMFIYLSIKKYFLNCIIKI